MKISTIIPVYAVENYLRDTLDSVIKQDIGFKDNIEVILVDDGSPDGSAVICREYVKKFPDNIRYVKQQNAGVSAARNNGFRHAIGEYVHFLDSDDLISKEAYSKAIEWLDKNENVSLAALRVEFFEGQLGEHPLNFKFAKGDRVVELDVEPNNPILHMSSCIIRRSAINQEFDVTIKISEDMKFLTEFLKDSPRYAVISSATYYYRKRSVGNSAIDGSRESRDFYLVTPKRVYEYLFDLWKNKDGSPHLYVQYTVAYDLQWRIRQQSQSVLSEEEQGSYKEIVYMLIKKIEDKVFFDQQFLSLAQLIFILKKKYGKLNSSISKRLDELVDETRTPVRIDFLERRQNGQTRFEGWVPGGTDMHKLTCRAAGSEYVVIKSENVHRRQFFLGDEVYSGGGFYVDVPDDTVGNVVFYDKTKKQVGVITRRQSGVPDRKFGYRVDEDRIYVNQNESIGMYKKSPGRTLWFEARWQLRILASLKLRESAKRLRMIKRSSLKSRLPLRDVLQPLFAPVVMLARNIRHVCNRLVYFTMKPFIRRPVWIFSDRFIAAGDNGEALFNYVKSRNPTDISIYFAIDKGANDFKRLRHKYGKSVIDSSGWWYRMLFLHSSRIISSHADDPVINPFSADVDFYYDLYKFDFVFLQHGIIRNDMSSWLNRFNKNIKLFVTSAEPEYESIQKYKYYYPKSRVLLSGLPRYDLLESKPKGKLILAPTWRHGLALPADPITGRRMYNEVFKESEYFKFFNNLMNDVRVIRSLEAANMTGEFYIHPALEAQISDFTQNKLFKLKDFPYDYRSAFREGSIMVTDYSSVLFDFAYLKKPIIYAQFDSDEFYAGQKIYTKGYMNDETDGFGPVVHSLDETVEAIVVMIESGSKMQKVYQERVDNFFKWDDGKNRERVYDAIRSL